MMKATELLRPKNWIPVLLLLTALVFRLWNLEMKPPHFDEGINGHFVMQMWKEGFYRYDPSNFHGPLYFYFLQASELIFGKGIFAFRFITILMSMTAIGLVIAHRRFFGSVALYAALVLAISPAAVFYARYAIHEWLFILCQVLFSYGYFLYREQKSRMAAAFMTMGVFGAFLTKETFFVFFGTWLIAIGVDRIFDRVRVIPEQKTKRKKDQPQDLPSQEVQSEEHASRADLVAINAIAIMAVLAIFSGFFIHTQGIVDMFRAFAFWTKTGTANSGHDKAFAYWLELMWRYEWPILLALITTPILYFLAKKPTDRNERIMILTAFGTWLAYSLIPYKTPWLILNLAWPLAFVFGFAVVRVKQFSEQLNLKPVRWVYPVLAVFTLAVSGRNMLELVFRQFVNPKEPYVYVQSTMQFKNTMDWIYERARARPETLNMRLLVLNRDTWPMPWTLGDFPNLTWGKPEDADLKNASVVLIDGTAKEITEAKLSGKYLVQPFQIRDAYDGGWAYFKADEFSGIVPEATSTIFDSSTRKVGK